MDCNFLVTNSKPKGEVSNGYQRLNKEEEEEDFDYSCLTSQTNTATFVNTCAPAGKQSVAGGLFLGQPRHLEPDIQEPLPKETEIRDRTLALGIARQTTAKAKDTKIDISFGDPLGSEKYEFKRHSEAALFKKKGLKSFYLAVILSVAFGFLLFVVPELGSAGFPSTYGNGQPVLADGFLSKKPPGSSENRDQPEHGLHGLLRVFEDRHATNIKKRKKDLEDHDAEEYLLDKLTRDSFMDDIRGDQERAVKEIIFGMALPLNGYLRQLNMNISDVVGFVGELIKENLQGEIPEKPRYFCVPLRSFVQGSNFQPTEIYWDGRLDAEQFGCEGIDIVFTANSAFVRFPFEALSESFLRKSFLENVTGNHPCDIKTDPTCFGESSSRYKGKSSYFASTEGILFAKVLNIELIKLFLEGFDYRCCCKSPRKKMDCTDPFSGAAIGWKSFLSATQRDPFDAELAQISNEHNSNLKSGSNKKPEKWMCSTFVSHSQSLEHGNLTKLMNGMWFDLSKLKDFQGAKCGLQIVLEHPSNGADINEEG